LITRFSYAQIIENSERVAWKIGDLLPEGTRLEWSRPFLPDSLTGIGAIAFLNPAEKLLLNHITGHAYTNLFAFVEEYIIGMAMQHAEAELFSDHTAVRALLRFAEEEVKHQQLFQRYGELFRRDFPTPCGVLGNAGDVAGVILSKSCIAVLLVTLHLELVTQQHYIEAYRTTGADDLDPLFATLLLHHWQEEAQHAKLDLIELYKYADLAGDDGVARAFDDYADILASLDDLLRQQAEMDARSLSAAIGRDLAAAESDAVIRSQWQAYKWMFIGMGLTNQSFIEYVAELAVDATERLLALRAVHVTGA
jgi:ferritin